MDSQTLIFSLLVINFVFLCVVFYKTNILFNKINKVQKVSDLKIDTIWDFHIRRATSEFSEKRIGTISDIITAFPEFKEKLDPIKDKLVDFWERKGKNLKNAEALLEIERHFGDDLLKLVCIPCGLKAGACLLLALDVAKDKNNK